MKRLYIVRHGQSKANVTNMRSGHTDVALTDEGRVQAKKAAEGAKDLDINLILTSHLQRAHDTARIIAHEIGYPEDNIIVEPRLIERSFGVLENVPYDPDDDIESAEGAEKEHELQARARAVYDYLQTLPADNILLVSHGSTARMLRHVVQPHIPFEHDHFANATIMQLL